MLLLALACTEPAEDSPSLAGQLVSTDGSHLSGVHLQACADVCVLAETDTAGEYFFENLEPGSWSIHAIGPTEDDADLVIPWEIPSERLDLVLPELLDPTPVPDTPAPLEVAEGLILELSPELLPGIDSVRAAPLEGPDWPPLSGVPGTPLRGWSLSPSGSGAEIPFIAEGDTWCTSEDGRSWQLCEGTMPELGSVVVVEQ